MHKIIMMIGLLALFLGGFVQAENHPQLIAHWKNDSIHLTLQKDGTYQYRLNALIYFSGKWVANNETIKLYYNLLGFKKVKVVRYHLEKNQLILKKEDRPEVILTK